MVQQSITNIMEAKGKEMIRWDCYNKYNFSPIFIVPRFVLSPAAWSQACFVRSSHAITLNFWYSTPAWVCLVSLVQNTANMAAGKKKCARINLSQAHRRLPIWFSKLVCTVISKEQAKTLRLIFSSTKKQKNEKHSEHVQKVSIYILL